MVKIAIGVGTNLGDRTSNIRKAYERIDYLYGIEILKTSHIYRTKPIGNIHQPDYYNAVLTADTYFTPEYILTRLLEIEASLGRHRNGVKWGQRIIDLDLLIYGSSFFSSKDIICPHPELHRRKFVLVPLMDCWHEWKHPAYYLTPKELLRKINERDEPIRV